MDRIQWNKILNKRSPKHASQLDLKAIDAKPRLVIDQLIDRQSLMVNYVTYLVIITLTLHSVANQKNKCALLISPYFEYLETAFAL